MNALRPSSHALSHPRRGSGSNRQVLAYSLHCLECLDDRALPSATGFLVSTVGDVSGATTSGTNTWTDHEIVYLGGPDLALEPASQTGGITRGAFSSFVDLGRFGNNGSNISAVHYVSRPLLVGTGTDSLQLLPGDLLLSVDNTDTFTSRNTLTVNRDEVFLFRPDAPGDYSTGTFEMVLDDFRDVSGGDETWALALVEVPTLVGDVTLSAGTFLFSRKGGNEHNDVRVFVPTGVGAGRTAGAVSVLIEGDQLDYSAKIFGLELVQETTTLGGRTLTAGTLLMSLEADDGSVGTNRIAVTRNDVFALQVTTTTLGSGVAAAAASLVFEGADLGLTGGSSTISAFALVGPAGNAAPVASDDAYTTAEDTPLSVAASELLANDTDPDGDPLTILAVTAPANGTAIVSGGTITYTPAANFIGTDSFAYTVSDGNGGTATATVTVTVAPVNDRPEAQPDLYVTVRKTPIDAAAPGVLANDLDVDGDALTAVLVAGPSDGTLVLNPDGSFTYTARPGFRGLDQFTYRVWDGQAASDPTTVVLTVLRRDERPDAVDDAFSVDEDGSLSVGGSGVLANDDGRGDVLTVMLQANTEHGTLTLNPDGTFTYIPDRDFYGTDSFTYRAVDEDGDRSQPARVVIRVLPLNDAPTAVADTVWTAEDTPLVIDAASLLANDTDPDGDALAITGVGAGAHGSVVLVDGTLVYRPNAGFLGTDTFTYTVSDGNGGTSTATVTVTVTATNQPPVAVGETFTTNSTLLVGAGQLLLNDSDPDGDNLTVVLVDGPLHGTLTLTPDGAFTYTPDAGFTGTDRFRYRVSDGSAMSEVVAVEIVVNPPTVPPPPAPPPLIPPQSVPPPPVPPSSEPPVEPVPTVPEETSPPPVDGGRPMPDGPKREVASAPPIPTTPASTVGTPLIATPAAPSGEQGSVPISTGYSIENLSQPTRATPTASELPGITSGAVSLPGPNLDAPPPVAPSGSEPPAPPVIPPALAVSPPAPPAVTTVEAPTVPPSIAPMAFIAPAAIAPDPEAAAGLVTQSLDKLEQAVHQKGKVTVATQVAMSFGVVATAGYLLLSPRTAFWLLSAVLARRTVWSHLDPLDVVFAWEGGRGEADDDETLESMVGKSAGAKPRSRGV